MGAAAVIVILFVIVLIVVGGIYASKSSSSTPATPPPKPTPKPVTPAPATGTPAQYASNPATTPPPPSTTAPVVVVTPPASPPAVVTPSAPVTQPPAPTTPTSSSIVTPATTISTPFASATFTPPATWKNLKAADNAYVPIRLNSSGDIECMSDNSTDCYWKGTSAEVDALVANPPAIANKPLVCSVDAYNLSNHWCNVGMKQLNPTSNKIPGPWKNLKAADNAYVPIRLNSSGDIECMSANSADCYWKGTSSEVDALVSNPPAEANKPLLCGPASYNNPEHWCNVGMKQLNPTSNKIPPPTKVYSRIPVVDAGYNDGTFGDKPIKKGYYDILGQGVPNDYCRYIGDQPNVFFACQLSDNSNAYAKTYNNKNITDIITGKTPSARISYYMRHNYLHY
jgi:hypothetical protein